MGPRLTSRRMFVCSGIALTAAVSLRFAPPVGVRDKVADAVAVAGRFFDVDVDDILSRRRSSRVVPARLWSMYLASRCGGATPVEIGYAVGGRDYTNVLAGLRAIEQMVQGNKQSASLFSTLQRDYSALRGGGCVDRDAKRKA